MDGTVQEIFAKGFEAYSRDNKLPLHHHKAAWHLIHCRTAQLGGHVRVCENGHLDGVWYNSCKHRSCPQCNQIQIERWLRAQQGRLIECAHRHLIFTIPHEFHTLWYFNTTAMSQLLFRTVRDTLMELLQDERHLGAEPGFILSLHTWGRSLALHSHLHCLITEGGLTASGHWQSPKRQAFLPARVLMSKFRGKFIANLRQAVVRDQVHLLDTLSPRRFDNLLNKLGRQKWNVHLRQRYPHGQGVATYLARYVRGGPLHNTQIRGLTDTQVCYRYYAHSDNPDGRKINPTKLWVPIEEFIRRYLQHVPEPGRQRVRSYGLYAHGKAHRLNHARVIIQTPINCIGQ